MEYRSARVFGLFASLLTVLISLDRSFTSAQPKYLQKCKEYVDTVFSYISDPTGLTDDKLQVDNCVNIQTLILGGENATSMEFPFMALVGYGAGPKVGWKCGGTLISDNFVLSAAHCSFNHNVGPALWVRLGELDILSNDEEASPEDIAIAERIPHPEFNPKTKYHDIALFRLAKTVKFNPYIRPICLYGGPHVDHMKSKITGWGATEKGTYSSILQKADVTLNTEQHCQSSYSQQYVGLPRGLNWTSMVCAKGVNFKDTCRGDSGGPLFVSITNDYYCMAGQIGVTSFGKACASNSPGVYTRVSAYIPWIESIVWPN